MPSRDDAHVVGMATETPRRSFYLLATAITTNRPIVNPPMPVFIPAKHSTTFFI